MDVAQGAVWSLKGLAWANSLPLYQEALLRSGIAEESQAPPDLQQFLRTHKFAQRNLEDGSEQLVDYTHQAIDILHEEIIRLELLSMDKNRLKRNAETNRMERDGEVFTQGARWLGFFGQEFVRTSEYDRSQRRYDKSYKPVLAIRSQIRKSGFLSDFSNSKQPFFSLDLKTEMHPLLHNFKRHGEENFSEALKHLSLGRSYCTLPCNVQPKTVAEEEKIAKRNELSKDELHKQAIASIKKCLESESDDAFLLNSLKTLENKKPQSFNPKKVLVELCSQIEQYIDNLSIRDLVADLDHEDEDDLPSRIDREG